MEKLTITKLRRYLNLGLLRRNRLPCSICRGEQPPDAVCAAFKANGSTHHYHGSDFGKCARSLQFDLRNGRSGTFTVPQPVTPESALATSAHVINKLRFFGDGHLHERAIVEELRSGGLMVTGRDDYTVDDDTDEAIHVAHRPGGTMVVVTHTDGILLDNYLLECKAVNKWTWESLNDVTDIAYNYQGQMQGYLYFRKLKAAFIIYKYRAEGEYKIFQVNPIKGLIEKRLDVLLEMEKHRKAGTWVPCNTPNERSITQWCDACKQLKGL